MEACVCGKAVRILWVPFYFSGWRAGSQFAEFQAQGLPGDPQQEGGPVLAPLGVLQDAGEEDPI